MIHPLLRRFPNKLKVGLVNQHFLIDQYFKRVVSVLFVHIPKTGGTSLVVAFRISLFHFKLAHLTADEQRRMVGEKYWDKKFSFAIVRNPWDRLVSYYHFERMHSFSRDLQIIPFKAFVKIALQDQDFEFFGGRAKKFRKYLSSQLNWIADADGRVIISYCGRFERLQEEVLLLAHRFGKSDVRLPHTFLSKRRRDYRIYYDDITAEIAAKYYAKDIEYFDYRFDL